MPENTPDGQVPDFWPIEAEIPQTLDGMAAVISDTMDTLAHLVDDIMTQRELCPVNRENAALLAYIDLVAKYSLFTARMSAMLSLMLSRIRLRLPPDPVDPPSG